ncbi:MAG TPA: SpoIIE family protein phosphatase [Armatimonadota bacterium]|nr:SpoIIE family protein phosphatase [Armatimonadota bacterium]
MRIATKLYLGFGILLALLAALGGLVAFDVIGLQSGVRRLSERELITFIADVQLTKDFTTATTEYHTYLMSHEPWRVVEAQSAEILFDLNLKRAMASAPRYPTSLERADASQINASIIALNGEIKKVLYAPPAQAPMLWETTVGPHVEALSGELEYIRQRREMQTERSARGVMAQSARLIPMSSVVVFLALVAALIAVTTITRSLLTPVRKLVRVVDDLASGDLTARVEWPYRDELGALATDFNRMADRIASTISELHETQSILQERNEALSETYSILHQEMELAGRIQSEILPTDCSYLDVSAAADMVAASDIGGDFYDVLPGRPGPDEIGFVVGDVSGKGIAAALLMVFVVTVLREICRREGDPAVILDRLNRLMRNRFGAEDSMYVTAFVAVLNRTTLRLNFSKAGHEEPFWYRAAEGSCEALSSMGLFVGLFSDGQYETKTIQLGPGDRLILFTDGVVEARNGAGKPFGADRLQDLIKRTGAQSAGAIIRVIKETVESWTGKTMPRDDMTLLVIEIPGWAGALTTDSEVTQFAR